MPKTITINITSWFTDDTGNTLPHTVNAFDSEGQLILFSWKGRAVDGSQRYAFSSMLSDDGNWQKARQLSTFHDCWNSIHILFNSGFTE